WGVSNELEAALSEFDRIDTEQAWQPLDTDPAPVIDAAVRRAESDFAGLDLNDTWACVRVFAADARTEGDYQADLFERFTEDYRRLAGLMDRFLPDPRALRYVDLFARLTRIRAYARATYLREDTTVDWDSVSAKVKKL